MMKNNRRISPVQQNRYKHIEEDETKELTHLEDYLDELEQKVDKNSLSNEDLYSQILELRHKIEKMEKILSTIIKSIKQS